MRKRLFGIELCIIILFAIPSLICAEDCSLDEVLENVGEKYYYEISSEQKEDIEAIKQSELSQEEKITAIVGLLDRYSEYYTAEYCENLPQTTDVIRDIYSFETVDALYVKIDTFSTDTGEKFASITEDMSTEKNLYIDLTDCSGGFIDSMLEVADCILPDSIICTATFKNSEKEYRTTTKRSAVQTKMLYVIVSENTASAAEILAGAVKQQNGGIVIGDSVTYGKTAIQQLIPISGGGVLKITVGEYKIPGEAQSEKGIIPHMLMPRSNTER